MAPSRKDKGKTKIDEGISEHQEYAQHAPFSKPGDLHLISGIGPLCR